MAKMFYTLEEAADKLGVTAEQVREMAGSGKLQQFRDRDKVMFKRDQIDAMANNEDSTTGLSLAGDTLSGTSLASDSLTGTLGGASLAGDSLSGSLSGSLADSTADDSLSGSAIPLADSGDTDAILLADDSQVGLTPPPGGKEDTRQRTGVSVFDAGEVEPVDPSAQTVVTNTVGADEELALESVGSGSGLLDLTRESDDTSLGAELLDEIYPGGNDGSDVNKIDTAAGASGIFDGAATIEPTASGLENVQQSHEPGLLGATYVEVPAGEPADPAGSGLTIGGLLGAMVCLVLALIVVVSAINSTPNQITTLFTQSANALWMYSGILLGGSLLLLIVGFFIGKTQER